jgi:hypothetical protein
MRTLLVGTLGSLAALFGFAATANASQVIDLIWSNGATAIGTNTSSAVATSSNIVLNVILTNNEPLLSQGGGVTVDYSDAVGKLTVVSFQTFLSGALGFNLGTTTDTGTQVRNVNAAAFIPFTGTGLGVGATYLLGTVTFHKEAGPTGTFNITSVLTATDAFIDSAGATSVAVLNGATLTNVPEPGTVSLLALGLGGLAFAARRKNYGYESEDKPARATCAELSSR